MAMSLRFYGEPVKKGDPLKRIETYALAHSEMKNVKANHLVTAVVLLAIGVLTPLITWYVTPGHVINGWQNQTFLYLEIGVMVGLIGTAIHYCKRHAELSQKTAPERLAEALGLFLNAPEKHSARLQLYSCLKEIALEFSDRDVKTLLRAISSKYAKDCHGHFMDLLADITEKPKETLVAFLAEVNHKPIQESHLSHFELDRTNLPSHITHGLGAIIIVGILCGINFLLPSNGFTSPITSGMPFLTSAHLVTFVLAIGTIALIAKHFAKKHNEVYSSCSVDALMKALQEKAPENGARFNVMLSKEEWMELMRLLDTNCPHKQTILKYLFKDQLEEFFEMVLEADISEELKKEILAYKPVTTTDPAAEYFKNLAELRQSPTTLIGVGGTLSMLMIFMPVVMFLCFNGLKLDVTTGVTLGLGEVACLALLVKLAWYYVEKRKELYKKTTNKKLFEAISHLMKQPQNPAERVTSMLGAFNNELSRLNDFFNYIASRGDLSEREKAEMMQFVDETFEATPKKGKDLNQFLFEFEDRINVESNFGRRVSKGVIQSAILGILLYFGLNLFSNHMGHLSFDVGHFGNISIALAFGILWTVYQTAKAARKAEKMVKAINENSLDDSLAFAMRNQGERALNPYMEMKWRGFKRLMGEERIAELLKSARNNLLNRSQRA